jgi:hypothetical protein
MKTYDDLMAEVARALESSEGEYDVEKITNELSWLVEFDPKHGYCGGIADIEDNVFWDIVMKHCIA